MLSTEAARIGARTACCVIRIRVTIRRGGVVAVSAHPLYRLAGMVVGGREHGPDDQREQAARHDRPTGESAVHVSLRLVEASVVSAQRGG